MRRGFISGIAMNGAALIHDFEIAMAGNTSEDVEAALGEGQFGMAEETGFYINEIAKLAYRIRIGYGEAAGQYLTAASSRRSIRSPAFWLKPTGAESPSPFT